MVLRQLAGLRRLQTNAQSGTTACVFKVQLCFDEEIAPESYLIGVNVLGTSHVIS
jgi:hypothetical protein